MKNRFYLSFILCFFLLTSLNMVSQNINHPDIKCPGGVKVNSFNGNMHLQRGDLNVTGRRFNLDMTFYYNSDDHKKNYGYGNGWGFQYLMQYMADSGGVTIRYADGFECRFAKDSSNTNRFNPEAGIYDSLVQYQTGKYVLITKRKIKYFFDNSQHRRLTRCEEPNGNFLSFAYTDSVITEVSNGSGRSIQLAYTSGKLSSLTDALDIPTRTVHYSYDASGNLTEVTDPAGNKRRYKYLVNGPMNTVTDKNGNTVDIVYNADFSVQEVISCITSQRFSYNRGEKKTYLTENNGNSNQVTIYKFDDEGNLKQKTGNCCGYNVSYEYDKNKNITLITDANGNKTRFTYDSKGNVLTKRDASGSTSRYTYEPHFNKVTSFTNRNGNTITYSYDNKGNRTQISYPLGVTRKYSYATNGDLTSAIDGNGNTTTYDHNANGDLTALHLPLGASHTFSYNSRGWLTNYTDPRNNTSTFTFDILHRITTLTDALGHPASFTYDEAGNLISYKDRENHTATFAYDALNRLIISTDPLNHSIRLSYDAKSNLISRTDANGNTSKYSYDNFNRLIAATNAANETVFYNYDDAGNITTISYPNGNSVNYTYDALNRRIAAKDNIGVLYNLTYDKLGNGISRSDANGNTRTFKYDALNRIINATDPLGHSTAYTYDKNSNRLAFTDKNGNISAFNYDELNRVIASTDALSQLTTMAYDLSGNLISITDANSHSTAYTYDALNRNTVQTFADGTTNLYSYDNNGKLISRTDNNGAVTNYVYDDNDRLITRDFPGSNDDAFTYDAVGRMLTATNNNAIIAFAYDAANRTTSETLNGKTTSYIYDIAGNKRGINYPGGRLIASMLDGRNRVIEIKEGNTVMASYSYDAANRLLVKNYPANGTFTSYNYDAANRLISMVTGPGNLLNFEYGYDNAGNKLFENKLHKPDHSELYEYDNNYQLTGFKSGTTAGNSIPTPLHEHQYNYDALGNRTTVTEDAVTTNYAVNNMNAYTSISGIGTLQYDNNGNLTNDGTFTYAYDAQNHLTSVNNGAVASYQYDPLGRRIRKTVGAYVTDFIYAGVHEIENRNDTGSVTASYLFGSGIDNILSAKIGGTDYFYYKNALGSVSAVAGNGGIVERYKYDPYGKISFYDANYNTVPNSSLESSIYYTGRTYDKEVDKYYYRARHYDALKGRFIQRDPLKYIDGLNLYAYTGNNVINYTDPSGTSGLATFGASGGSAATTGSAAVGEVGVFGRALASAGRMANGFAAVAEANAGMANAGTALRLGSRVSGPAIGALLLAGQLGWNAGTELNRIYGDDFQSVLDYWFGNPTDARAAEIYDPLGPSGPGDGPPPYCPDRGQNDETGDIDLPNYDEPGVYPGPTNIPGRTPAPIEWPVPEPIDWPDPVGPLAPDPNVPQPEEPGDVYNPDAEGWEHFVNEQYRNRYYPDFVYPTPLDGVHNPLNYGRVNWAPYRTAYPY